MYCHFFKRLIDICVALLGLLILSPVFVFITICLFFTNKGKPFFLQKRPGKNERIFKILKFKTMNDKKDVNGNLLPNAERLTQIGIYMRKSSLDEIPQLINILKGDMSLIGPRPLLVKYLPYYTKKEKLRHRVRPGITGWAQLKGRNRLNWDARLAYDIEYVRDMSFAFDVKIFMGTIKKVIKSEDIVTTPELELDDLDDARRNY